MRRLSLFVMLVLAVAACGDAEVTTVPGGGEPSAAPEPVTLTCGEGLPFSSDALDGATGAEDGHSPEADVLRSIIASRRASPEDLLPPTGWRVLADTPDGVIYGAGGAPRIGFATVWRKGGTLDAGPAGSCQVRRYREGYEAATWVLHGAPAPETRDLVVEVTEGACADGQAPGDRLQPRELDETDDAVTLTFWVRSQTGMHTCPGNPATTVTVHLDRALGDRSLLDGRWYPPRDLMRDEVDAPTATTGPASTTVVTTGPAPDDPDAAEAAIDEAFHDAFDADVPREVRDAAVEDGPELAEAGQQASVKYPDAAKTITVTVHSITFIDQTHAAVTFELSYSGAMLLGAQDGQAVFLDGRWKVSHATRCAVIVQAGVACP
jgi:hypothetical protein